MRELAQSAGQGVVFAIVEWVGEVVAPTDGGFAVRWSIGLVGGEVDFAEEPGLVMF